MQGVIFAFAILPFTSLAIVLGLSFLCPLVANTPQAALHMRHTASVNHGLPKCGHAGLTGARM